MTTQKPEPTTPRRTVASGYGRAVRRWRERQLLERARDNPTAEREPAKAKLPYWLPLAIAFVIAVPFAFFVAPKGYVVITGALFATAAVVLLTFGVTRHALRRVKDPDLLLDS